MGEKGAQISASDAGWWREGGGRRGEGEGGRGGEGDFRVLKDGETERMEGDRKRGVRG